MKAVRETGEEERAAIPFCALHSREMAEEEGMPLKHLAREGKGEKGTVRARHSTRKSRVGKRIAGLPLAASAMLTAGRSAGRKLINRFVAGYLYGRQRKEETALGRGGTEKKDVNELVVKGGRCA